MEILEKGQRLSNYTLFLSTTGPFNTSSLTRLLRAENHLPCVCESFIFYSI